MIRGWILEEGLQMLMNKGIEIMYELSLVKLRDRALLTSFAIEFSLVFVFPLRLPRLSQVSVLELYSRTACGMVVLLVSCRRPT